MILSLFFFFLLSSCTSSAAITSQHSRDYSSVHTQQPAGPIREYKIDPYMLLEDELKYIFEDIRQVSSFPFFIAIPIIVIWWRNLKRDFMSGCVTLRIIFYSWIFSPRNSHFSHQIKWKMIKRAQCMNTKQTLIKWRKVFQLWISKTKFQLC